MLLSFNDLLVREEKDRFLLEGAPPSVRWEVCTDSSQYF